jgi:hypothetical protein
MTPEYFHKLTAGIHPGPDSQQVVLLCMNVWNTIVTNPDFLSLIDLTTNRDLLLRTGWVGTINGIRIYTDGFKEQEEQMLSIDEFEILSLYALRMSGLHDLPPISNEEFARRDPAPLISDPA